MAAGQGIKRNNRRWGHLRIQMGSSLLGVAGNRIPNLFPSVNWAVKNVGYWRASILFLQGHYFSIRLDIFKCRNYKTKSRISARKMWRGLISGCLQSCGWPQRIPGKQQNLQNWVCCNLPSREQIQILVGQMLQIPPAEQSQGSCWKPYPDFIWEECRGTWPSGAWPHKTSTLPLAKPWEGGTLLKLWVLMIQLYLKQCHTHKGRFHFTERTASYAPLTTATLGQD